MSPVFVALLLGTGVMRLVELGVSVRRMRARPTDVVPEPWLFPAMAVLHGGLVALPLLEVLVFQRPWIPALSTTAIAVFAVATLLRVWTLSTIGRAWNVRVVAPPADAIATTGPYAWVRHPNYLVVILEIASLPLIHTAWWSAVVLSLLNAFVLAHRIRTEEAVLARNPEWLQAFAHKPRLIPGVF